ncbi:MAG TPA: methyltransferase [Candidatus Polarisedimenticolaceae bacterium]|nr:methyltransferase [Candidatus Polarisedimenticolaceae bacterium]
MPTTSRRRGIDERASYLAPELLPFFDDAFVRSCDLFEEYVGRLTGDVFARSGLSQACREPVTVAEAIERAGLDPRAATVPVDWMFRMLASRGRLAEAGEGRYRVVRDDAEDAATILAAQEAHDPRPLPSFAIAALAAERYPAVLRGETTGERALFTAEHMSTWAAYFSNANVIYSISNKLAAVAGEAVLPSSAASILEIGGGLGSGAAALCGRLVASGRDVSRIAYRFTEVSIPFLRRGRALLEDAFPGVALSFARLDMNAPFGDAGVERGSADLVLAVNALHVAKDLSFTLGEIREALAPTGSLVAGECLRPFPRQAVYVEFVFNLLESFRDPVLNADWRPNGGFLTPEQWTEALTRHGFRDVRFVPDVASIRDDYPSFVIAAIVARRA